ncbi:MAG: biopolymer transporter ExbD [Bacteroidales bacterium]|nr:biopolymer transporter ExbD [Bacteroidales bacterium]
MAIASKNKSSINFALSGMTDIVFLLLLFFMLVSTLTAPVASNIMLPQSNNQTVATPLLTISITNKMEYMVDGTSCTFDQVEPLIKEKLGSPKEPPTIRINADENVNMDEIYKLLEIAKQNRFKVILGTRSL